MPFTPPNNGATRLSKDVWLLICEYARENGNSSTREAIEQLIRQTIGSARPAYCQCSEQLEEREAPSRESQSAPNNAAAALDALLLE